MDMPMENNNDPGKFLRALRERRGLSRPDLARQVGTHPNQIQKLENNDRTLSLQWMERLAPHLGISTLDFVKGVDAEKSDAPEATNQQPIPSALCPDGIIFDLGGTEFARIPVYDVQFSAGFGAQNDYEQPLDYHVISVATLRRLTDASIKQLLFLQVRGDSMEPVLFGGDWVLVDASRTNLVSPAIYAMVYEGEGFLKHASKSIETGSINLVSHNPAYAPQTVSSPEKLRIVGRVVLSIRRH